MEEFYSITFEDPIFDCLHYAIYVCHSVGISTTNLAFDTLHEEV